MKKINNIIPAFLALTIFLVSCKEERNNNELMGRVKRDLIAVTGKIPGRIVDIKVQEGQWVKKGDTLAVLDIPEADAKALQANGAITAASAQLDMAKKGATKQQLIQLKAKESALTEQFVFAEKSIKRLEAMLKDSMIPQQKFDEAFAKHQGAKAQLEAVKAQIKDVKNGVRIEKQMMALGQKQRAEGALAEVNVARNEKYILAAQNMSIETISLNVGELALPGYTLFSGYLKNSAYFRFTVPESKVAKMKIGEQMMINIPHFNKKVKVQIWKIKQLTTYASITNPYPDFEIGESVYEVHFKPLDKKELEGVLVHATSVIEL